MIFDCHVHLPSANSAGLWEWYPCTPDVPAAVSYLRRCGVERALANSIRGIWARTPEDMRAGNDETLAAAREYPDFIVPTCLVNGGLGEDALAEVRRCRDAGVVWLGELCGYASEYSYGTESFRRVVELATELQMVVQFHEDSSPEVDRLCTRFPETTWVLAHLGDSPEECRKRCELAAKHTNLHLDICGHGYQRMGILECAVACAGTDRVLFGSDYTINDPAGVIVRVQMADLDAGTKEKVLGRNVTRLLRERGVG